MGIREAGFVRNHFNSEALHVGRRIGFLDIARVVEETLGVDCGWNGPAGNLDAILATDGWARTTAGDFCRRVMMA